MSPEEIQEALKICDAATPGPWEFNLYGGNFYVNTNKAKKEDLEFIDFARTALPKALAALAEKEKHLQEVIGRNNRWHTEAVKWNNENSRLKAALEFYADEENWAKDSTIFEPVFVGEQVGGARARAALEGK